MIIISNDQRNAIARYLDEYAALPCGKSLRKQYARQRARAIARLLRRKKSIRKADLPSDVFKETKKNIKL